MGFYFQYNTKNKYKLQKQLKKTNATIQNCIVATVHKLQLCILAFVNHKSVSSYGRRLTCWLMIYSVCICVCVHTHTHTHTRARSHTHTHTHRIPERKNGGVLSCSITIYIVHNSCKTIQMIYIRYRTIYMVHNSCNSSI